VMDGPFALTHHPGAVAGSYVLAGHIHPCATLTGVGRQRERLPCFWFGAEVGVLPSFGEFTGCAPIDVRPGNSVFAVTDDRVIRVAWQEEMG
jgi:metallophosphoesterase superfamily enzyme